MIKKKKNKIYMYIHTYAHIGSAFCIIKTAQSLIKKQQ